MITWRFLKRFPKFLLVAGILTVSTGLFVGWWYLKFSWMHKQVLATQEEAFKKRQETAATIPSRIGHLLVADRDLYDLESGALVLKNWLSEETPSRLFFDAESQKIVGLYPRGLVRFHLDGRTDATIANRYGLVLNEVMSEALYAKDKDIWKAVIDLVQFKLVNEQRVTTTGAIMEQYFAGSILLKTDKVLIIRNLNQTLRIDLVTGETTAVRMQLPGLKDNRSPDGKVVVGATIERMKPRFFAYDLEQDETKYFDLDSRQRITAFAWLNRDLCACITGTTHLSVYDRQKQEIRQVMQLPGQCTEMYNPSPTGRYVFCESFNGLALIDIEAGKIEPLGTLAQDYRWIGDDTLLCARDVPDTKLRGSWLKKIGQPEQMVSTESYTFTKRVGASVIAIEEESMVVFGTKEGLFKLRLAAPKAQLFAPRKEPVVKLKYLERK